MPLKINQVHARIGIETKPPKLQIQTRRARLELEQKFAEVEIETRQPQVLIDQSEALASTGLKGPIEATRDAAQRAYSHVMEYLEKKASDGDILAAIENGGNPIAEISARDAYPEHEFGLDFIPKTGPRFEFIPGWVKIKPQENPEGAINGVLGKFFPGEIKFDFTPAKVRIYMERYASVNFRYEPEKIDLRI